MGEVMYSSSSMSIVDRSPAQDVVVPLLRAARPAPRVAQAESARHEFEAFFRAHHGGLVAFLCRRVPSRADAEEIAQESCIRLLDYGALDSRPEPVWRALLYRVAINLAIDRERQPQRGLVVLDVHELEPGLPGNQPQPDALCAAGQDLDALHRALERMPAQTRRIFFLSRVHQKNHRQIAEACGISVKAVEKHITRALRGLRVVMRASHEQG